MGLNLTSVGFLDISDFSVLRWTAWRRKKKSLCKRGACCSEQAQNWAHLWYANGVGRKGNLLFGKSILVMYFAGMLSLMHQALF